MTRQSEWIDQVRCDELEERGYCVFRNVLDPALLERLVPVTDRVVGERGSSHAGRQRTTGSMVPVTSDPLFVELVTLPAAWNALRTLGFGNATFSDGWVISKPGHGPRLFWHYDWFTWEDAASYRREPLQVSLMYYLNDTRRENGCLRVIPGSHTTHNELHDHLSESRDALTAGTHPDLPEFDDRPDEVDVPIRAGDLLVADARLLHAAHANTTGQRRRLITLWYQPDLAGLPERMQAQMAAKTQQAPDDWPEDVRDALSAVQTAYHGSAVPYGRSLYRRYHEEISSGAG